jgi:hypothetical protein
LELSGTGSKFKCVRYSILWEPAIHSRNIKFGGTQNIKTFDVAILIKQNKFYGKSAGENTLPGYGPVTLVKLPVRTHMQGVVRAGGEKPPLPD